MSNNKKIMLELNEQDIEILKDMKKEYELLAKYNGARDYDRFYFLCNIDNAIKNDKTLEQLHAAKEEISDELSFLTASSSNNRVQAIKDAKKNAYTQCLKLLDQIIV